MKSILPKRVRKPRGNVPLVFTAMLEPVKSNVKETTASVHNDSLICTVGVFEANLTLDRRRRTVARNGVWVASDIWH